MQEIEITYTKNAAGQFNSNSLSIANLQEGLNLEWNAIFDLSEKIKEIGGEEGE